jgi:hypothetical protein
MKLYINPLVSDVHLKDNQLIFLSKKKNARADSRTACK